MFTGNDSSRTQLFVYDVKYLPCCELFSRDVFVGLILFCDDGGITSFKNPSIQSPYWAWGSILVDQQKTWHRVLKQDPKLIWGLLKQQGGTHVTNSSNHRAWLAFIRGAVRSLDRTGSTDPGCMLSHTHINAHRNIMVLKMDWRLSQCLYGKTLSMLS